MRDLESVAERARRTLEIADRWGYGLSEDALSRLLYGGPEDPGLVSAAVRTAPGVVVRDGFAALREDLVAKSVARHRSNGVLSPAYFRIADEFAEDLLRHSPFVRAVSVSGSTASGGLAAGEDVDFNLFAEDGTKYAVYLTALLLGLKYSLRYGRRFARGASFLGILPKVTCVNVVWTESQVRPFARTDEFLAFELLRSVPIAGTEYFARAIRENPWLARHFPQVFDAVHGDRVRAPTPSLFGRLQGRLASRPTGRRALEGIARAAARALHRVVDLSRERDPLARERRDFLRRVKAPYDVFQD